MRAYQQVLAEIEALGASLVAISPQTADNSLSTREKNELHFEVLTDANNTVARSYGLVYTLSPEVVESYRTRGRILPDLNEADSWELPVPGTFVLDGDGIVRLRHVHPDYTRRLEPDALLDALRQLG